MLSLCALAAGVPATGLVYPHVGSNAQAAGGGGACTYEYADNSGAPVVVSAKCSISTADLNTGSEPTSADRTYIRALGEHEGCDSDDSGHILAKRLGGLA
jgi:hypothetical protein